MKTGPVRVLHVLGTLNRGGAESRIMDLYRHLDREKVQFDFLVHTSGKDDFAEEVKRLGGAIYTLPRFKGYNLVAYELAAYSFFMTHTEYDVVEGHMTSTASIYLPKAKKAYAECGRKGPVTIAHVRSAGTENGLKGIATEYLRRDLKNKADFLWSCSLHAGEAVYGEAAVRENRVEVIPNAIEAEAFLFDPAKRMAAREEYGIAEDAFVIGHVGRFEKVKNQAFLVECLADALAENDRLLFVGKGPEQDRVRELCEKAGLAGKVLFTGALPAEKVADLYRAMDVFALPSLYDGVPGTVVEAQVSGLPCVISDRVTDEVCLTKLVERIPLGEKEAWQRAILAAKNRAKDPVNREKEAQEALQSIREQGYDAAYLSKTMEEKYLELADGR